MKKDDDKVKVGCEVERKEARVIGKLARAQDRSVAQWIRQIIRAELAKEA